MVKSASRQVMHRPWPGTPNVSTSGSRPSGQRKRDGVCCGPGATATAVSLCICLAGAIALSGCGGRTIVTGSGTTSRPATSWVFDAGSELALAWHVFPMIDMATIYAGAYHDGQLIVLCNLGGQSEVLRPSHAYVLSVEDGRILKSVSGPSGLDFPKVVITDRYAYFRHLSQWRAFDLVGARVTDKPPLPPSGRLARAKPYTLLHDSRAEVTEEQVWQYRLGKRYQLTVSGRPGHKLSFDLSWDDPSGKIEHVRLCQLPYRMYPGGRNLLFLDDGKNLVFSWSWYLICVNVAGG